MFSDPQSLTINSVAISVPRFKMNGTESIYQSADTNLIFKISHAGFSQQPTSGGRIRTVVRSDQRFIVPDPLTAVNDYETLTYYTVIDRPVTGITLVQTQNLAAGHNAWMSAGNIAKLFGGES